MQIMQENYNCNYYFNSLNVIGFSSESNFILVILE